MSTRLNTSAEMGTEPVGKALLKQSIPAGIGFMVMSIYMIVDTIFVGRYVGPIAIAAITVVLPVSFLISSFGMAIGVGGASIISRALGRGDDEYAYNTFGNQATLTLVLALSFVVLGFIFDDPILRFFGARGDILPAAKEYFEIIVLGVPFLAWAMMSNNVVRAEGKPKIAMMVMAIPAFLNLILDPIFIIYFEWGLKGAAWATSLSYVVSAGYIFLFFLSGKSELKIKSAYLKLKWKILSEIGSLGGVTLARQGAFSVLSIVLNNTLFEYGGEEYVAVFGIINRVLMFSYFPILGITQGFMPIAGYNYGAQNYDRVLKLIKVTMINGTLVSTLIYILILVFRHPVVKLFTTDEFLLDYTPKALIILFAATPIVLAQVVGAGYFQAIGKAVPALLLTLSKQIFFLVPLLLIFPVFWGLDGVWVSFPIADTLATAVTVLFLRNAIRKLKTDQDNKEIRMASSSVAN